MATLLAESARQHDRAEQIRSQQAFDGLRLHEPERQCNLYAGGVNEAAQRSSPRGQRPQPVGDFFATGQIEPLNQVPLTGKGSGGLFQASLVASRKYDARTQRTQQNCSFAPDPAGRSVTNTVEPLRSIGLLAMAASSGCLAVSHIQEFDDCRALGDFADRYPDSVRVGEGDKPDHGHRVPPLQAMDSFGTLKRPRRQFEEIVHCQ